VGGGGKAGGHLHTTGQLRDHFSKAGVFAADGIDVGHAQMLEGHDQIGRGKQVGHGKTPLKLKNREPLVHGNRPVVLFWVGLRAGRKQGTGEPG
jgi:hypothetical protein